MSKSISPEQTKFLALFGEMMVSWNRAETSLQTILMHQIRAGEKTEIVIAHMSSNTMIDAVKTLSFEFAEDWLKEPINHFIKYFERIREYRNYYVHGIIAVVKSRRVPKRTWEAFGDLHTVSARGEAVYHPKKIWAEDLRFVIRHSDKISALGFAISYCLINSALKRPQEKKWLRSLQQMPPLPERLKKPRRSLRS